MRSEIGFAVVAIGLTATLVWWVSTLNDGPDVTGPTGAEVIVADVPNPAVDPEPVAPDNSPPTTTEDIWALPFGFRQLLDRDAIAPIYDPVYTTAEGSEWADDVLVVGVALNGEARAYPVGHLNRREMVIDTIGGIPVLVTW